MKQTRLGSSTDKFGEAQAEGVVAVLAAGVLAFGAALIVHWG